MTLNLQNFHNSPLSVAQLAWLEKINWNQNISPREQNSSGLSECQQVWDDGSEQLLSEKKPEISYNTDNSIGQEEI